jgi:hypothetical protein
MLGYSLAQGARGVEVRVVCNFLRGGLGCGGGFAFLRGEGSAGRDGGEEVAAGGRVC